MKCIIFSITLFMGLTLGSCNFRNHNDVSIQTEDSNNYLHFTANYPERKTEYVQNYIEKSLKEPRIFNSVSASKQVEIKLNDGTQFYLSYKPGYVSIDFNRDKNSVSSYFRLKNMMKGFGESLK